MTTHRFDLPRLPPGPVSSLVLFKQSQPGSHDSNKLLFSVYIEHQVLFTTYTYSECTEKSGSPLPTVVSAPLLVVLLAVPFSTSSFSSPATHPSLPPSLSSEPMLHRGETDTALSARGV